MATDNAHHQETFYSLPVTKEHGLRDLSLWNGTTRCARMVPSETYPASVSWRNGQGNALLIGFHGSEPDDPLQLAHVKLRYGISYNGMLSGPSGPVSGALIPVNLRTRGVIRLDGNATMPPAADIISAYQLESGDGFWCTFVAEGADRQLDHAAGDGGNWADTAGNALLWPNGADGGSNEEITEDNSWRIFMACNTTQDGFRVLAQGIEGNFA